MFDFSGIKRSLNDIEERAKRLASEIAALKAQRATLENATPNRTEMKALIQRWTDERAKNGYLQEILTHVLGQYRSSPVGMRELDDFENPLEFFGNAMASSDQKILDRAMFSVFSAEISKAFIAALDVVEWPDDSAPLDKRRAERDKIGQRVEELQRERRQLCQQAKEVGIEIR